MQTFRGLSSPDELAQTWINLTEGQNIDNINIIFDFVDSSQLKEGPNIINLLFKYIGNKTGHYVAVYKSKDLLIYFDPLGTIPPMWLVNNLQKLNNYKSIYIDLEGSQKINGNSCGYRCLTKLLKYSLNLFPEYYIIINDNHVLGMLKPSTIEKTKRELKTLQRLQEI